MANIGARIGVAMFVVVLLGGVAVLLERAAMPERIVVIRDPKRSPVQWPLVVPKGWEKIDVGGHFTLYAPPGSYHHPERGDDSLVGEIITPQFALRFDFGLYSNDLRGMTSEPGHVGIRFLAAGHPATMHIVPDGKGFGVGAYVGDVHCGRLIVGVRCDWDSLMIEGNVHSAAERDEAAAMFRTLEFPGLYESSQNAESSAFGKSGSSSYQPAREAQ